MILCKRYVQQCKRMHAGDVTAAIDQVQNAYFDQFEASGFEGQIGAHDAVLKTKIEGQFTKFIGAMKVQIIMQHWSNS